MSKRPEHFIPQIQHVFVDPAVENDPQTKSIASRINTPIKKVCPPEEVFEFVNQADEPIAAGKKVLFLTQNRGRFLRSCPGTRHYQCCRYMILHVGTYCPMDCAYCILQTFFHPPVLQYFVNHDVMDAELTHFFSTTAFRRIGTGEYTDSLIWSGWTPMVEKLVHRFGRQNRVALELKTKTDNIGELEHLDHNRKTIIAWSLNTEAVIATNEIGTASLQSRLEAAARCQAWGYPLAFHFDPIIIQEGAEDAYTAVVAQLFDRIDPVNIAWISLGTFRCVPPLKPVIQRRFPESDIVYGEFIHGLDGKMRYFKPLRTKIYRSIIKAIRSRAPEAAVYFCMESRDVWERTLDLTGGAQGALADRLDQRAIKLCHLS
ncbi:MAG: DNA photolyase [Desulfobacterales bacterium]|nr:DNA photolyase [Desulfobacterales bacterium]MDJ0886737.1 DNA photolyase [Desulfobacterales bacterium]